MTAKLSLNLPSEIRGAKLLAVRLAGKTRWTPILILPGSQNFYNVIRSKSLVGNAAAAVQGTPVTTVDIDFLFRKAPANIRKLKAITRDLNAVLMRPFYPASDLFRIQRDVDQLQLDFMGTIDGVASIDGPGKRATRVRFGDATLLVGSLADIIKSKKAARRPQDLAVLPILEETLAEKEKADHAEGPARGSQTRE